MNLEAPQKAFQDVLSTKEDLNTSDDDLMADFYVPAFQNAVSYDRGVGYFSSGWLQDVAGGLAPFAARGGKARFVVSPHLTAEDAAAIMA